MAERSLHGGHRARMRERFLTYGDGVFADHELLEQLLYYALPRRNTNDLAHTLIETYGSLSAVLEADEEELAAVAGVGEQTAHLIAVCAALAKRYAAAFVSGETDRRRTITGVREAVDFLRPHYIGVRNERLSLILLDNAMRVVDFTVLGEGSVSTVALPARTVLARAVRKNAAAAILAHNHPDGVASPSNDDIAATKRMAEALRAIDVVLLEHIILTKETFCAVLTGARHLEKTAPQGANHETLRDLLQQKVTGFQWEEF